MKLEIIGTGYVGLVSGACFAELGHDVTCVDTDEAKIAGLNAGRVPIHEPGLEALVAANARAGRLRFTTDSAAAATSADAVFIAVGTPTRSEDGFADLRQVFAALDAVAPHLRDGAIVVSKSTVPVGTAQKIEDRLSLLLPERSVDVASCPEFLREGSAVRDFMKPARIVVGVETERAAGIMRRVHAPIVAAGAELVMIDRRSAELAKYAANAFLATKITFINEMADFCEKVGADVEAVARVMGLDPRIGPDFLRAGPGYGGSCFPKDNLALLRIGEAFESSLQIVETAVTVNERRKRQMARRVIAACGGSVRGKRITILGVTFKANTDDMRDAPSIPIVRHLAEEGAELIAFDPAPAQAKELPAFRGVRWADTPDEALAGADAAVIVTEWDVLKRLDLGLVATLMATPLVIDLRNLFRPADAAAAGIDYLSVGRPQVSGAARRREIEVSRLGRVRIA